MSTRTGSTSAADRRAADKLIEKLWLAMQSVSFPADPLLTLRLVTACCLGQGGILHRWSARKCRVISVEMASFTKALVSIEVTSGDGEAQKIALAISVPCKEV